MPRGRAAGGAGGGPQAANPAGPNPSHVLTPEHKDFLKELFISGLTPWGVQAHLEQYNRECQQTGKAPFPSVNLSTIKYHYRRMRPEIQRGLDDEIAREQLIKREGLRNRDIRIKRLEIAAEKLEPFLGQASPKGEFTAAEMYVKILAEIRQETEPKGGPGQFDPTSLRGMPLEKIKELAADMKKATGTGGTP